MGLNRGRESRVKEDLNAVFVDLFHFALTIIFFLIIGLFLVCFDLGDLRSVLFVVLSFCLVFLLLRERERTSRWVALELGRSGRSLGGRKYVQNT